MVKIKGQKVQGRNVEVIPILRPGENIVFLAEAIENFNDFDKLCPEPTAKMVRTPAGMVPDPNDTTLQEKIDDHNQKRTAYMVLKSLEKTPELEWETVDINKPETWENWRKELEEGGFTQIEIGRILTGIMAANSLSSDAIEEAKKDFLLQQSRQQKPS